jgi:hypothetical protein
MPHKRKPIVTSMIAKGIDGKLEVAPPWLLHFAAGLMMICRPYAEHIRVHLDP